MLVVQEMTVSNEYKYDWEDQFWAANVLLALTTDGGTFHGQTISFLQYWICGTDEVHNKTSTAFRIHSCSQPCASFTRCCFVLENVSVPQCYAFAKLAARYTG